MSAEQAAAQAAVAAANTPQQQQQQQPHGTPQQTASTPASIVNSSGDQLVCQWQSCGERLPSAEQLYVSMLLHGNVLQVPRSRFHVASAIASQYTQFSSIKWLIFF
jgi:hypothetical protein